MEMEMDECVFSMSCLMGWIWTILKSTEAYKLASYA